MFSCEWKWKRFWRQSNSQIACLLRVCAHVTELGTLPCTKSIDTLRPETHTLTQIKVHKVEHQGHFTKTPFHLAFLLNKGSEMFNRAVRNLCLNIKKRSFKKKKKKGESLKSMSSLSSKLYQKFIGRDRRTDIWRERVREREVSMPGTSIRETESRERHLFNTTSGGFYSDVSLSPHTGPQE